MNVLVVYESSYGNTHLVADAIGDGLGTAHAVEVVPVARAAQELVDRADLIVVGGPTHVHGMSHASTRQKAIEVGHEAGSPLQLDPDAEGPGLREWFDQLQPGKAASAAFDTRVEGSALITGRASKGISKQLRHHGFHEIAEPMSFLVTKDTHLVDGQQAAARQWGAELAATLADHADPSRAG